jgi:hypothetical protein
MAATRPASDPDSQSPPRQPRLFGITAALSAGNHSRSSRWVASTGSRAAMSVRSIAAAVDLEMPGRPDWLVHGDAGVVVISRRPH